MRIFCDHKLSCYFFNSCPCWSIGTSNLDLKLATIIFLNIDATRVARPDGRWIRSSGTRKGSTLLAAVCGVCTQLRYQAWRGCRWMPGVYAQPRPLETVVMCTCLSTGRELPLVFREEPGVSRVARVMPCPLVIWIQGTRHLPPSPPPVVTAQVVQEDCPFLPVFSFCPWTQEAR